MENVTAKAYFDFSNSNDTEKSRVIDGLSACHAFWQAAQQLPNYAIEQERPHNRCIYAALAVRDIINKRHATKAQVYPCGLDIRLVGRQSGKTIQGIAIGNPAGPSGRKDWNAHLVVRLGNFIFDPTLIQASRNWNDLPHIGAFAFGAPGWHVVSTPAGHAKTAAMAITPKADDLIEIAYFDIPAANGFETRSYKASSNSAAKQRRDVVSLASELLHNCKEFDMSTVVAQVIAPTVMGRLP